MSVPCFILNTNDSNTKYNSICHDVVTQKQVPGVKHNCGAYPYVCRDEPY